LKDDSLGQSEITIIPQGGKMASGMLN